MHIIANFPLITKQVEFLRKQKFTHMDLYLDNKTFIIYIVFFANCNLKIHIYFFYKVQIALIKVENVFTIILFIYSDFANIFDHLIELTHN